MATDGFRCSESAEERDESLFGTASVVKRWLLLEQPGSWGRDALSQSRLPQSVATELRRKAQAAGVRVILIRRGVRLSSDKRQCYFLRTEDRDRYQAHMELDDVSDILDVDLAPLRERSPIAGATESDAPLYLVCTHGRHDQCCSIRGNQVSRVACSQPDMDAWECSHIGGDRFAANLVCFPHGLYYGRVDSGEVAGLMQAYARGSLSLDHYRGRSCYGFAVQAAEYFARRDLENLEIDGVTLEESSTTDRGVRAVFSVSDGRSAVVEVRISREGPHRLTCGSNGPDLIPHYELASCLIG